MNRIAQIAAHLETASTTSIMQSNETSGASKITISSHVLDTSKGFPAAGMPIHLERLVSSDSNGEKWETVSRHETNDDGRVKDFAPLSTAGTYRLTFDTTTYFKKSNVSKYFYPKAVVEFIVDSGHYHVPLLINPFGYSTYRGS